ncbi:MAG: hypothetical protein ACO29Q_07500 [Crocinitomicaceae bacterium]
MKFYLPLLISLACIVSCNTDRTAEIGRLDSVSDTFGEAQLSFKERDVQLESIHLSHPSFKPGKFNDLMSHLIMHDTIGVFCTEQEQLDVRYIVQHYSKSLLCMKKEVRVKCPMGNKFFQINENQTYLLKKDSIYQVKFTAHADFKKQIGNRLTGRKLRLCTTPNMDQLQFMIVKGKPHVFVSYSYPLCDTLMAFEFKNNTLKVQSLERVKLN